MITVKISSLINSVDILKKLAQQDFKAKLAWSISRLLKAVEVEIQNFNDTRFNLINKYGVKNENNTLVTDEQGNCKIEEQFKDAFTNELNELLNTEIEINANQIPLTLLEDVDFTPSEITLLEAFIDENR